MIEVLLDERSEELINAIMATNPQTGVENDELEETTLWSYKDELITRGLLKKLPPSPRPSVVIRNALEAYKMLISYEEINSRCWPIITSDTASEALNVYEMLPENYKNRMKAALFKTDTTIASIINYCKNQIAQSKKKEQIEKETYQKEGKEMEQIKTHNEMMKESGFYRSIYKKAQELGKKWKDVYDPDDCMTRDPVREAIYDAFSMYDSFLNNEKKKQLSEIDMDFVIGEVVTVAASKEFKTDKTFMFGPGRCSGMSIKLDNVTIVSGTNHEILTINNIARKENRRFVMFDITLDAYLMASTLLTDPKVKTNSKYDREMYITTKINEEIQRKMTDMYNMYNEDIEEALKAFSSNVILKED